MTIASHGPSAADTRRKGATVYGAGALASQRADVVIVGGGFAGLCAAAALADGRRSVLVLEARTARDPRFRGELMHPRGVRELARLGLHDALRARGGEDISGFAVVDGERVVRLAYGDGARGYAMDHPLMVEALRDEVAKRPGVRLVFGAKVAEVLRESGRVAGVRASDGREFRASLTLVCEGRHSKLRGMLGLDGESELLSYSVALLAPGAGLPAPGHGHVVIGGPGPLLAYPIGGAVRFCIDVPASTEKGRDAIARRLREEYAPTLPPVLRDALERGLAHAPLELCANHRLRTERCVVPGAALVADAGGCSHPLTAAGMTNGLDDVRALADLLDAGQREPLDHVLAEYEKRRYRYLRARELLASRLYGVFLGADEGHRGLRDGMLRYWERSPRARAASMALLSGESNDVGAFAREFGLVFGTSLAVSSKQPSPGAITDRARVLGSIVRATYGAARGAVTTVAGELARAARPAPVRLFEES